jgi:ribonuclease HI
MKTQKKKYYAIIGGKDQGLHYDTWNNIELKVNGNSGVYSKCLEQDKIAAMDYFEKHKLAISEVKQDIKESTVVSIPEHGNVVDGACNQNTGEFQYQVFDLNTQSIKHTSKPYLNGTNNIAEFFAIICALRAFAKTKSNYPIYSDSTTAIKWVKDRCCNTKVNDRELLMKISEQIEWLRSNNCPNPILKWETKIWGENPADFGRK